MTTTRITRRNLMRSALVASSASLVSGCKPTSTGSPLEPKLKFESGAALPWSNWAANHVCEPSARWAPTSEDELVSQLGLQQGTVRPVGAGHSFSPLVPTDGTILSTDLLSGLISSDDETLRSEVWAGTRLHQLGPLLEAKGQALPNLPDIDYQTLAGATATSTHGTGIKFGSLSSQIHSLALATPSGELLECDREQNPEIFHASRCSLGALGVITRMTLNTQRPFRLVERTRVDRIETLLEDVDRLAAENRHFELYAFPHSSFGASIEINEAQEDEASSLEPEEDAAELMRDMFRGVGGIPGIGDFLYDQALNAAAEGREPVRIGPSYAVLAHERLTRFREMEYTVPADAGPACLREILEVIRNGFPVIYPIEYRYVKNDDIWLSMFHERDGCSISIHQFADEDHREYFKAVERVFWKYDGRPHWGKIHSLGAAELTQLYPNWKDFVAVRDALDPSGKMLNDHLKMVLGAGSRANS